MGANMVHTVIPLPQLDPKLLLRNGTRVLSVNQVSPVLIATPNDTESILESMVKLMNRMKEEAQRHKEADLEKKREIAQLRKASRRQEHQIRSLESDTKIKEVLLRRKNEEVSALRRATRTNMSNKAAGRVGPRHTTARSKTINFSPKVAKQKWQAMEKNISKMALNKQAVAAIEREMERQIAERERLSHELEKLTRQRDLMCRSGTEEVLLQDLDEQIENIRANIEYVQENITEAQQNIVQVEETKGGLDGLELGQGLIDVNEARYFIEKLYNMTVSQTYTAAQKELSIKEMESKLNEMNQRNKVQDELFQHVVRTQGLDLATLSRPVSSNSSNSSSRSTSPTDTPLFTFDLSGDSGATPVLVRSRRSSVGFSRPFGSVRGAPCGRGVVGPLGGLDDWRRPSGRRSKGGAV
uniref:KIF21A/B second helical domain-containing protein n=1 Tax=Timema monikensis TaxID=170555 RepID=A0A7R9HW97_9NEOP|nr:unnamed protein product [Timema monikensis]